MLRILPLVKKESFRGSFLYANSNLKLRRITQWNSHNAGMTEQVKIALRKQADRLAELDGADDRLHPGGAGECGV